MTYTDGTSEEFRISDPDWRVPTLPVGVEPAVTMPYRNFGNGTRINRTTYVYLHEIPPIRPARSRRSPFPVPTRAAGTTSPCSRSPSASERGLVIWRRLA